MIIREATLDDIPSMLEPAKSYFDHSGYDRWVEWSADVTARTFEGLITNDAGGFFVAEADGRIIGGISAIMAPLYFAEAVVCQQLFWFVVPEARGRERMAGGLLARHLIKWAKAHGCTVMVVGSLAQADDGETSPGVFWRRMGFAVVERQYWGAL